MPTCEAVACAAPARARGYCDRHYRRRLHTGRYGYRDAAAVRTHVAQLRELGWTWEGIAKRAGTAMWTPLNVHSGRTTRVLAESEAALLAVPLVPFESHRGVPALGARRRVQALAWMGWPNHEIAARIGCSPRTLPTELSRGRISARLAQRITAVYEELSMTRGPSKMAAVRARDYGWLPPLAWDDETIDDPASTPVTLTSEAPSLDEVAIERAMHGDAPARLSKAEREEAVRRLTELGYSAREIAERLHIGHTRVVTRDRSVVRRRSGVRTAAA